MRSATSLALVVWLIVASPSAAEPPMQPAARKHLELGIRLYTAQRYEKAIEEFREGYSLDPKPEFLFAMAQAERLNGDCRGAVVAYKAFLRTEPSAKQVAATNQHLDECQAQLAQLKDVPPAEAPASTPDAGVSVMPLSPPPVAVAAAVPAVAAPSTSFQMVPVVLAGFGLAVVGTGIGLRVSAQQGYDALVNTCMPVCDPSSTASIRVKEVGGDTALVVGLVGLAIELAWWLSTHPRAPAGHAP